MLLRLLGVLAVPLRHQNEALQAAGFGPRFDDPKLASLSPSIAAAIDRMAQQQEPYPMLVLNAHYDVVRFNRAAASVFAVFMNEPPTEPLNFYDVVFDLRFARSHIENFVQIGAHLLARLHRECLLQPRNQLLHQLLQRLLLDTTIPNTWRQPQFATELPPTLPLILARDTLRLSFFTVVTTFAAPQLVTLEELRIDSYFPVDEVTKLWCENEANNAAAAH